MSSLSSSSSSFCHILPSNAAIDSFPDNNASLFSIPIDDAETLTGDWQVALAQISYSNCLYTFINEIIHINESRAHAYQCETGCRIYIPRWPASAKHRKDVNLYIQDFIQKACVNIMTFTGTGAAHNEFSYKVTPGWIVCLSDKLKEELGFGSSAFTSYDTYTKNDVKRTRKVEYKEGDYYLDIIPQNVKTLVKKIIIKPKNSDLTIPAFEEKFNALLKQDKKQLAITKGLATGHISIEKLIDDDLVLVCSKYLHKFLHHRTAALHGKQSAGLVHTYKYTHRFTKEWTVSLYQKNKQPVGGHRFKEIVLAPRRFVTINEAVQYLNDNIDSLYIKFYNTGDILTIDVGGDGIEVEFVGNTLKDILGFDQKKFQSGQKVSASAKLSLTRRINYFQIYSNIGVDVRIGDTEAPLLAIIPFNPKECGLLSERNFKKLTYVDLRSNYMPQINIAIYDDAGALVPFYRDAITTLTLHFKRKYY